MRLVATWKWPSGRLAAWRVRVYDCVASTNALALQEAHDEANDRLMILAQRQTAGRGQHGRKWTAPPDSSVLMSVLIFPPPELRRPVLLTAWAAVAVCRVIEDLTGLVPYIKWPNDVLLKGKKICGILIEQRGGTVAGIGLNVRQTRADFEAAGLPEATSLLIARRRKFHPERVATRLLEALEEAYREMAEGTLSRLEQSWRAGLGLLGREVTVECHTGEIRGIVRSLSFAGVEIEQGDGTAFMLLPERILHLKPHS